MDLFLKIMGVLFLALIGFVVVVVLAIRARFRQMTKALSQLAMSLAQPVGHVSLRPIEEPGWNDASALERLSRSLAGLGFQEVGSFEVEGLPGVAIRAWVHPGESVYAVVYEHRVSGVWLDFLSIYQDGTIVRYSNSRHGELLDHRPGQEDWFRPGLDPVELHKVMLAERPNRPLRKVTASTFVEDFENARNAEIDWRTSRGGPSLREIQAIAEASGEAFDEEVLEDTHRMMRLQALDELDERLRTKFLEQYPISALEWETLRDRVVIVHDRLTPEVLLERLEEWFEDEDQLEEIEAQTRGLTPREAFIRFNWNLPESSRFRKLGELKEPVEADVYQAPE